MLLRRAISSGGVLGMQARTRSAPFRTITPLSLFFLTSASLADAVDDYVQAEMERPRIPGAGFGGPARGNPVKMQAYDLANAELNAPVRTDTVFRRSIAITSYRR